MRQFSLAAVLCIAACARVPSTVLPDTTRASLAQSVPAHVQTATYLWSSAETATSPDVYAPYLTYAYVKGASQAAATQSAGIKVVSYIDPIMPCCGNGDLSLLKTSYPTDEAKNCSGQTITVYGGRGLLSDPRKSIAASYYSADAVRIVNNFSGHVDYGFIDNASSVAYNVDNGPPCGWTPSAWGSAIDTSLAPISKPLVLNALNVTLGEVPTYVGYLKGANIVGGQFELCYTNASQWAATEEAQLQTVALLKSEGKPAGPGFWCYRDATSATASYVTTQRLFEYASFLLTYDPQYSVFQSSYTTLPSTFQVFPETGLVALQPQITVTQYTDLKTSSGAYVQIFGACYYRGSSVGPCEVAANPSTTNTVSLPNAYAHSMTLSGGGVLDGGSVSFSAGPVTSLAPLRGAILIDPPTPLPSPSPTPTATASPTPTATATAAPTAAVTSAPTLSGVVDYLSSYDGCFFVKTASGVQHEICPESYTVWTNKSALKIGASVTADGYWNKNGVLIASSITVQ